MHKYPVYKSSKCLPTAWIKWTLPLLRTAAHTDRTFSEGATCPPSFAIVAPPPTSSLSFLPGPLDHGLWRAVQEDEFGVHFLLQVQLSCLPDQEDVCTQLEDAIHVGQLLKHDGVGNAAEKLSDKLANDQDNRGVKSHDPGGERWCGERV